MAVVEELPDDDGAADARPAPERACAGNDGDQEPAREGLLARRARLQEQQRELARRWAPSWVPGGKLLLQNLSMAPDADTGPTLTPSGAINLTLAALVCFGLFAAWFVKYMSYGLVVLFPVAAYTAMWLLYPMVEPSDGSKRAVETMTKHPFLRQAQLEGCDVLYAISRQDAGRTRSALVAEGALEALLDAAIRHETDAAIVARVFAVVGALAKDAEVAADLVNDEIVEFALLHMQTHLAREAVQKHAMVLLVTLVAGEESGRSGTADEARARALRAHAVETVCRSMDAHLKVTRIQQWGPMLLTHLTDARSGGAEPLHKGGVLQQVAKTMENHATAEPILQISVGLLAKCLTANPENPMWRKRVTALKQSSPRLFELVRAAQERFPKSPGIQSFASRILHDVAQVP